MIRLILLNKRKDERSGYEDESYFTLDIENKELEQILTRCGFSENGYETNQIVDAEVIKNEEAKNDK